MEVIIAQILGLIALILVSISYFIKSKSTFLIIQIVANAFYAGAFLVVGAFVGGIVTFISIFRCIYIYYAEKYNFKYKYHFISIFFVLYIITTIIWWTSWIDIIPLITCSAFTIAFVVQNLQTMRYIVLAPNMLLVGYCILNKTYTSAVLDFLEVVVVVVAIIKHSKSNKQVIG